MAEPAPDRVLVSGPLASFAGGFRVHLVEQGYSLWSVQFQLQLVAHLSRWMEAEELDVAQLAPSEVERFLAERRREGYVTKLSPKGIRPLLGYLDGLGVLPAGENVGTAVGRLLDEFRRFLLEERALAVGSVGLYEPVARVFLEERSEPIGDALARLSAAEVNAFVLRESRRRGRASALTMVCALRSLLRFLHVRGLVAMSLAPAVPSIPRRREDLPRGLVAGQVRSLLDSCDRATSVGRRDFAILTVLARLGLRRGEVARLELEDVDWRAAEIVIHGKGSRIDRLPLPGDVGEALADYLRRGRPVGFGRTLLPRCRHDRQVPSPSRDRARQQRPHPQRAVDRDPLVLPLRGVEDPRASRADRPRARHSREALRHDDHQLSHRARDRRAARRAGPQHLDRPPRPRAVAAGGPDRAASLRAREPALPRPPALNQRLGPVRRQRPKGKMHAAHPPDRSGAARLATRPRRRPNQPAVPQPQRQAPHPRRDMATVLKHAATAGERCPSLATKNITPHVLRHTAAMRLLHAPTPVDTATIALWLGHETLDSTNRYLHADMELKRRALDRTASPNTKPGRYRPPDPLLAFLEGL
jgi:integrase/recombinase XerD